MKKRDNSIKEIKDPKMHVPKHINSLCKTLEMIESKEWQEHFHGHKDLHYWQPLASRSMEFDSRFELDCESYKEYLDSPTCPSAAKFDEIELIDIIVKQIDKNCNVPYFISYMNYLKNLKIKLFKGEKSNSNLSIRERNKKTRTKSNVEFDKRVNECSESIKKYLNLLMKVERPIIGKDYSYSLGTHQKGAITAFVHALKQTGKVKNYTDEVFSNALNFLIPGLNLGKDGRTLRNTRTTEYNRYFKKIKKLIETS